MCCIYVCPLRRVLLQGPSGGGRYGELAGDEEELDYDSEAEEEDAKRITLAEVLLPLGVLDRVLWIYVF